MIKQPKRQLFLDKILNNTNYKTSDTMLQLELPILKANTSAHDTRTTRTVTKNKVYQARSFNNKVLSLIKESDCHQ